MSYVISSTEPVARKDHNCMACYWLRNSCPIDYLTFAEKRAVVRAKRNGWKIKKGQKYLRYFCEDGGVYTFKAIPEIHNICIKYDLYEE